MFPADDARTIAGLYPFYMCNFRVKSGIIQDGMVFARSNTDSSRLDKAFSHSGLDPNGMEVSAKALVFQIPISATAGA